MRHATSAPRGKSCIFNNYHVAKSMTLQHFGGARDLFQTKKLLQGCFSNFLFFAGTKIIFKPFFLDKSANFIKRKKKFIYVK